jgi:ATP-dependent DNA helicase RecQ
MKAHMDSPDIEGKLSRALALLTERFGHTAFRPGQEAALRSVFSGRDVLAVMPTGSGKSMLYQLPALVEGGLTLVISPLISLMKDQVDELGRRGVAASFVNSSLGRDEQQTRLDEAREGRWRLLYVAPERFRNQGFVRSLRGMKITRLAVDEAHCISEWGHDFRPDYRRIAEFRDLVGAPKVTSLTATATPRVQEDIVRSLGLTPEDIDVHISGFDRPNLELSVFIAVNEKERRDGLLAFFERETGSGIVYASTRRVTEELTKLLRGLEPGTIAYHAGLDSDARTRAQEGFLSGKNRVVVATSAFGMGIDKSDIRFVIHHGYPGSLEQYYQEIGRAGRDDLPSRCVLFTTLQDHGLRTFFIDLSYPAPATVRLVYKTLAGIEENPVMMTYREIAERTGAKIPDGQVGAAIRLLDRAGVTRALSFDPRIGLVFEKPGADALTGIRGPMQRRVLEAVADFHDLQKPGRVEMGLGDLAFSSGLDVEQVRRALEALDSAGVAQFEPPFRGRGVEKLVEPFPRFDQVEIDWEKQAMLRGLEEEKLKSMEGYLTSPDCRRGTILAYFGETRSFQCGSCDRCQGGRDGGKPGVSVLERRPEAAFPVLVCIQHLRFPLGVTRVAQVVTGSKSQSLKSMGVENNPAYDCVHAGQEDARAVIADLIREGYLAQTGDRERPVLALTSKGGQAAKKADLDAFTGTETKECKDPEEVQKSVLECVAGLPTAVGARKIAAVLTGSKAKWIRPMGADRIDAYGSQSESQDWIAEFIGEMIRDGLLYKGGSAKYPVINMTRAGQRRLDGMSAQAPSREGSRGMGAESKDPARLLEQMVTELGTVSREEAMDLADRLTFFKPDKVVEELTQAFDRAEGDPLRARFVWAAGEVGGLTAVPFLLQASRSPDPLVRMSTARALGVVLEKDAQLRRIEDSMRERAMQTLEALSSDRDTSAAKAARESLEEHQ